MDGGSIYEYDESREAFHLRATDNLDDELVEALRAAPIPKGEGVLGQLAVTAEPVQIRDIVDERVYRSRVREILLRLGFDRCSPCRCCARTTCSAGSSSTAPLPANSHPR